MAATKQSQAIGIANDVLTAEQQIVALLDFVNSIVSRYNKISPGSVWNALATAALATDGSLGAVDGTPNNAHPIDTRVVTSLARAVAANDLVTAISNLEAFQSFMQNGAVSTADREAVFRPQIGG